MALGANNERAQGLPGHKRGVAGAAQAATEDDGEAEGDAANQGEERRQRECGGGRIEHDQHADFLSRVHPAKAC